MISQDKMKASINKFIFLIKKESPREIKISKIGVVPRLTRKGDTLYEYDVIMNFTFECEPFMDEQLLSLKTITQQLESIFMEYGLTENGEIITEKPNVNFFDPTILELGALSREDSTTKCSLIYNIFHE